MLVRVPVIAGLTRNPGKAVSPKCRRFAAKLLRLLIYPKAQYLVSGNAFLFRIFDQCPH